MQQKRKSVNYNNKTVVICLPMTRNLLKENLLAAFRYLLFEAVGANGGQECGRLSRVQRGPKRSKRMWMWQESNLEELSGKDPTIEGISLIANIETK